MYLSKRTNKQGRGKTEKTCKAKSVTGETWRIVTSATASFFIVLLYEKNLLEVICCKQKKNKKETEATEVKEVSDLPSFANSVSLPFQ